MTVGCQYLRCFFLLAFHEYAESLQTVFAQQESTGKSDTKVSTEMHKPALNWDTVHVTSAMTLCAEEVLDAISGPYFMHTATSTLKLVQKRLPKVRTHLIFYCKAVEQHVKKAFKDLSEFPALKLKQMGGDFWNPQGWAGYQKWMVSWEFWNEVEGDKLLVYQPDVHICNNAHEQLQKFFKYDYVGAPWQQDLAPQGDPRYCSTRVGNGGLSLRDIKVAKSVLKSQSHAQEETGYPDIHNHFALPEDAWWCQKLANSRIPPFNVAAEFAVEGNGPIGPTTDIVGVHDVFNMTVAQTLEPICTGITEHMTNVQIQKRKRELIGGIGYTAT
mmetsp:Transcript_37649/g.70384  ORF Transcript_37649/g.70384 Transcript_37649/m.70384 type:complete len:329 (-) Transcript_37649:26-1012(-)